MLNQHRQGTDFYLRDFAVISKNYIWNKINWVYK